MSRRFVFGFGRFKPIDIAVFIGVNILVSLYIWKPYFSEMATKKLEKSQSAPKDSN